MEEGWQVCSGVLTIAAGIWMPQGTSDPHQGSRGKVRFMPLLPSPWCRYHKGPNGLGERLGPVVHTGQWETPSCPQPGTDLRVHLLQRAEEGYEGRAPKMGDGAQPREQALVQHLLEVPLADVLKERSVHVRWPNITQRGMASSPVGGQAHQHGGAQVKLLGQLRDVDVHGDQVFPVCLLHLADDVCQPLKLPLCARHPDEVDLRHMGMRLSMGPALHAHPWESFSARSWGILPLKRPSAAQGISGGLLSSRGFLLPFYTASWS